MIYQLDRLGSFRKPTASTKLMLLETLFEVGGHAGVEVTVAAMEEVDEPVHVEPFDSGSTRPSTSLTIAQGTSPRPPLEIRASSAPVERSEVLSEAARRPSRSTAPLGFEPRHRDPESRVLPLHYGAMEDRCSISANFFRRDHPFN